MAYIFIGEVGDSVDRTLLDSPLLYVLVIELDLSDFESALFVFLEDFGVVNLYLFQLKATLDNIHVMLQVVFEIGFLFATFPEAENVVFLGVPDITLVQSFECQNFMVLLHCLCKVWSLYWLQMYTTNR